MALPKRFGIDAGYRLLATGPAEAPPPSPPPPPGSPVVSFAGSGYQGSTYTSTAAGQWTADAVAISGETGTTYVMSFANEGKAIRCGLSNTIEMWVPGDGSALEALLDIRQGLTLSGASVTAWASQANGRSATQATGSLQPQYSATSWNGSPGLTFSNDRLVGLTLAGSETARSVIMGATPGAGDLAVLNEGNGTYSVFFAGTGNFRVLSYNTAEIATATGSTITPSIFSQAYNNTAGTPVKFRQNGVSRGSPNSATTAPLSRVFSLGGTDFPFVGVMSSIVIYDAYSSDAVVQFAEGWVAWTLGQQGLLDASHPYKAAAPRIS